MGESESNSKIKTDIPFLFYDVIGRMMPGAYLIFGVLVCSFPFLNGQQLICVARKVQTHAPDSAITISIIGICTVLFFCASAICGFVLASLSHLLVEEVWNLASPLNYEHMKKFVGDDTAASINKCFHGKFGAELKNGVSLNRPSFLCAYYIWRADVNLGQMQGRHDADLLAAQPFVLVSVILTAFTVYDVIRYPQPLLYWWLIVLVGIGLGSGFSFHYHRKKRVYGRFEMFLALCDETPAATQT